MCISDPSSLFEKIKILESLAPIKIGRRSPFDWYASLEHVESKESVRHDILCSFYANGRTPDESIKNLFDEICEMPADTVFVLNAYGKETRKIYQFRNLTWIQIEEEKR